MPLPSMANHEARSKRTAKKTKTREISRDQVGDGLLVEGAACAHSNRSNRAIGKEDAESCNMAIE